MNIELLEKLLAEFIVSYNKQIIDTSDIYIKHYLMGRKEGFEFILDTIKLFKGYQ